APVPQVEGEEEGPRVLGRPEVTLVVRGADLELEVLALCGPSLDDGPVFDGRRRGLIRPCLSPDGRRRREMKEDETKKDGNQSSKAVWHSGLRSEERRVGQGG